MFDNKILLIALLFNLISNKAGLELATSNQTGAFFLSEDIEFCSTYCTRNGVDIPANKIEQHVNCKCYERHESNEDCHLVEVDYKIFRWMIIKFHNEYRDLVAEGNYSDQYLPEASDMNAISYDVGLGFTALCTAKTCAKSHDACLKMKNFPFVSQNQFITPYDKKEKFDPQFLARAAVASWLNQNVQDEKNNCSSFLFRFDTMNSIRDSQIIEEYKPGAYEPATTMLHSQIQAVGCGMTHDSKNVYIVCNYGSNFDINSPNERVYRTGGACSQCSEYGCNTEYESLCGQILPIPIANLPKNFIRAQAAVAGSGLHGTPIVSSAVCSQNQLAMSISAILLCLTFQYCLKK